MSLLDKLSKFGGFLTKPFEILADYVSEPIRDWDHARNKEMSAVDHAQTKDLEQSRIKAESDARIRESEHGAQLAIKTQKLGRELDEWVKDQEIARFERVTEAIMRYRQQFAEMNNSAIFAIGQMQIELRRRAHDLVEEKTRRYKALQSEAFAEAVVDLTRIEQQFSGNPTAKAMLEKAVDTKLAMVIDGAGNLMKELEVDLKLLSESITRLADRGEEFMTTHLQNFHSRQVGGIEHISMPPPTMIGKP